MRLDQIQLGKCYQFSGSKKPIVVTEITYDGFNGHRVKGYLLELWPTFLKFQTLALPGDYRTVGEAEGLQEPEPVTLKVSADAQVVEVSMDQTESIERRALRWALTSGDTGISSEALCAFMLGIEGGRTTPPADAADRGRCIRLLELIPEWIPRLHEMAEQIEPVEANVFGSGGMRTETYSWAKQVPLIIKEGGFGE